MARSWICYHCSRKPPEYSDQKSYHDHIVFYHADPTIEEPEE